MAGWSSSWSCREFQAIFLLSLLTLSYAFTLPTGHPLNDAVHRFETLHKDDVQHRFVRENMPHPRDNLREVHLTTQTRRFRLILSPNSQHLHGYIRVQSVNSSGHTERHPIQFDEILRGHVFGERFSHVTAHVDRVGVVTAIINLEHDTVYIEPSHRHIHESHDFHMITYKASDLKMNITGNPDSHFCGAPGHHMFDETSQSFDTLLRSREYGAKRLRGDTQHVGSKDGRRLKRQSSSGSATVCRMALIATYSFHMQFGGSPPEVADTINYLILLLSSIDGIFSGTQFGLEGVTGAAPLGNRGIEVADITVITQSGGPDYNNDDNKNSEELLRIFAIDNWESYCLAHLFIGNSFSDSRLGVAYIASPSSTTSGGICNRAATFDGLDFSGNTGVSSYRNNAGRLLLLAESLVVTTHELGHNWGSFHDPDTPECNPSQDEGGKYIMYEFAQDGSAPNNNVFSNCSIQGISRVLNGLEGLCFVEPSDNMCGNFIPESGEQCDPGPGGMVGSGDQCCSSDCQLTGGVCSDANHDCCNNCQPKNSGEVCRTFAAENSRCLANTTCDGGIECPSKSMYASINSSCGTMGQCIEDPDNLGQDPPVIFCQNFCEREGYITCHCTGVDQCKLCCLGLDGQETCTVYPFGMSAESMNLPEGSFCEGGTCEQGECIPSDPDLATFVFDIILNLNINAFLKLVEDNLVGTVIFLSLIIWIPVSSVVHCFDIWWSRRQKEDRVSKPTGEEYMIPLLQNMEEPEFPFNPNADPEKDGINKHMPVSAGTDSKSTFSCCS